MSESVPKEIVVDTRKETKSVVISPEIQEAIPHLIQAFGRVERPFLTDPESYLTKLEDSVFTFKSKTGAEVACSLLYDDDSKKDELLVIWAPFLDGAPRSTAEDIYKYTSQRLPGGLKGQVAKEKAAISSWNQTTKSSVIFELLGAIGSGMPVLTIYSPISTKNYTRQERQTFSQGDYSPASHIALEAIQEAQRRLHGSHSETRIDKANMQGSSLGASNAIGAAKGLLEKDIAVPTVTAQELILGPASFSDVAKRFSISGRVGEPSGVELPKEVLPRIYEPHIRRKIDKHGSELSMYLRMIQAAKPTYLTGLAHPEKTVQSIENLLDNNVSLLVALAENSALTHQTKNYLPHDKEKVITVRAEKGQYADHMADEHVALTALIAALNLKKPHKTVSA